MVRKITLPRTNQRYNINLSGSGAGISDFFLDSSNSYTRDAVGSADYAVSGGGDKWQVNNLATNQSAFVNSGGVTVTKSGDNF